MRRGPTGRMRRRGNLSSLGTTNVRTFVAISFVGSNRNSCHSTKSRLNNKRKQKKANRIEKSKSQKRQVENNFSQKWGPSNKIEGPNKKKGFEKKKIETKHRRKLSVFFFDFSTKQKTQHVLTLCSSTRESFFSFLFVVCGVLEWV